MSKDIIEFINGLQDLYSKEPVTIEEVQDAEKTLGLKFADDFTKYLLNYGGIIIEDVELMGLGHPNYDTSDTFFYECL